MILQLLHLSFLHEHCPYFGSGVIHLLRNVKWHVLVVDELLFWPKNDFGHEFGSLHYGECQRSSFCKQRISVDYGKSTRRRRTYIAAYPIPVIMPRDLTKCEGIIAERNLVIDWRHCGEEPRSAVVRLKKGPTLLFGWDET
jgi:hypothetical protein